MVREEVHGVVVWMKGGVVWCLLCNAFAARKGEA